MKRRLEELLAERPVAHPSVISRLTIAEGRLEMVIDGIAWWSASNDEGQVCLFFEFPQDGSLDLVQFGMWRDDEMLEDFAVVPLADTPWALEPEVHSTYCRGPLLEPLAIFRRLHDALLAACAPWGPFAYLNGGPTLAQYCALTENSDYLLSEAPSAMHAIIVDELERQQVKYSVLSHLRQPSEALSVRLNGQVFICREAHAEW